jgi:hypothetical protein
MLQQRLDHSHPAASALLNALTHVTDVTILISLSRFRGERSTSPDGPIAYLATCHPPIGRACLFQTTRQGRPGRSIWSSDARNRPAEPNGVEAAEIPTGLIDRPMR